MTTSKPSAERTLVSCLTATFGLLAMPFWYYLLYQILVRVDASTAMWVCYWIYLPVSVIAAIGIAATRALFGEKA